MGTGAFSIAHKFAEGVSTVQRSFDVGSSSNVLLVSLSTIGRRPLASDLLYVFTVHHRMFSSDYFVSTPFHDVSINTILSYICFKSHSSYFNFSSLQYRAAYNYSLYTCACTCVRLYVISNEK